jgi:Gametolysin peptidase M11
MAQDNALTYFDGMYRDIREVAHHIIIVVPDLFDGYVAAAEIATRQQNAIAVYNNIHATYLSVLMHETAHNLGLAHAAWQDMEYGDKTGYMGASSAMVGGPLYCFNAANHWQLQWYSNSRLSIDKLDKPMTVIIPAFVDYLKVRNNAEKYVLVKVGNIYMQYNRAKDYNIGTKEMIDQLVLIRSGASQTERIAGLDMSNSVYDDEHISIDVCKVESINGVDQMIVSIGRNKTDCHTSNAIPLFQPPLATPQKLHWWKQTWNLSDTESYSKRSNYFKVLLWNSNKM